MNTSTPGSQSGRGLADPCCCRQRLILLLSLMVFSQHVTLAIDQFTAPRTNLDQSIAELIEQLGDERYTTRELAQARLSMLGLSAFEAISEAQSHHDIEISLRAKYLLHSMRINWTQDHDPVAVKTILKGYEQLGNDQRVMQMHALAQLEGAMGVEALCRLVRFERTDELSKEAAVLVLAQQPPDELGEQKKLREVIRTTIGPSQRSGALWLGVYADWFRSPGAALQAWDYMVRGEEAMLARSPDRSSPKIVRYLLRRQAEMLCLVDRPTDVINVVSRLFEHLNSRNEIQLLETADWLAEQQQWDLVVKFSERQQDAFHKYPLLAYRLAEAHHKLGDHERSERQASAALAQQVDNDAKSHRQVAQELKSRGMFDWAEQEYRRVMELSQPASRISINAHYVLSEMLHDAQRDLDAAGVLEAMQQAIDNSDDGHVAELQSVLLTFRTRKEYFLSQHHAARGEWAQQRQALERAIQHDRTDADVLIAMYRLPGQDEVWKAQTIRRIEKVAAVFRQRIQEYPEDAAYYNQLAWLTANTEGDYDEALDYSRKSLELDPHQAGYLDTLARCYFAKGDLERAIKHQTQAVKLEPFTMQIKRQLEFFQSHQSSAPPDTDRAK